MAARVRRGRALPRLTRKRRGHSISFTLSEHADVSLSFERARRGRRYSPIRGRIALKGKRGTNHVVFRGALRWRRALVPGIYRLTVNAEDPGKLRARPKRARFRLLP